MLAPRRVKAVAEGRAVVQVEYAPLEALDEGVQVGRPRWELVPADAKPRPRARDFLGPLFVITAVGKMTAWRPRIGSAAGEADDGPELMRPSSFLQRWGVTGGWSTPRAPQRRRSRPTPTADRPLPPVRDAVMSPFGSVSTTRPLRLGYSTETDAGPRTALQTNGSRRAAPNLERVAIASRLEDRGSVQRVEAPGPQRIDHRLARPLLGTHHRPRVEAIGSVVRVVGRDGRARTSRCEHGVSEPLRPTAAGLELVARIEDLDPEDVLRADQDARVHAAAVRMREEGSTTSFEVPRGGRREIRERLALADIGTLEAHPRRARACGRCGSRRPAERHPGRRRGSSACLRRMTGRLLSSGL